MQVSYVDPGLDRCVLAHEWLSGADIYRSYNTSVATTNNMEHNAMQRAHMPSAAAAVHFLCRIETRADLTYTTRTMSDYRFRRESNVGLVAKFKEGLAPKARAGNTTIAIETVPFALWVLSAGDGSNSLQRGVTNLDILNKQERKSFDTHVKSLRALGLTYISSEFVPRQNKFFKGKQEDKPEGTPVQMMKLEPDIGRLVYFAGYQCKLAHRRKKIPSVVSTSTLILQYKMSNRLHFLTA